MSSPSDEFISIILENTFYIDGISIGMAVLSLMDHKKFQADYAQLKHIPLNPERHKTANAFDHCEMVKLRVLELAKINSLTQQDTILLKNAAMAHDIGKVGGTSHPAVSVEMLAGYGIEDPQLINLVKYHDINLPWYQSFLKGKPPGDKDWKRLGRNINLKLLCLFMIADRVDCPGGWKNNRPLVWFLVELRKRDLLSDPILLEDGTSL